MTIGEIIHATSTFFSTDVWQAAVHFLKVLFLQINWIDAHWLAALLSLILYLWIVHHVIRIFSAIRHQRIRFLESVAEAKKDKEAYDRYMREIGDVSFWEKGFFGKLFEILAYIPILAAFIFVLWAITHTIRLL